jgi:hypothetical protein
MSSVSDAESRIAFLFTVTCIADRVTKHTTYSYRNIGYKRRFYEMAASLTLVSSTEKTDDDIMSRDSYIKYRT